ncbi:TPA: hypothetical protein DIU27_04710 [Candidatus Collierbacteria bacterium]|uniref:Uncharacterized protein n=1 Tax=Candidatus Collierbacteria bacterium GW2011_GWB2_44_22 TaxID=1618387 RepID=A0A0G1HXU8_9BACT|nr:MAG: hypothetical protein UW31_C0016G0020 [Candidatus Collierbacteria bacterium GW2011_GWA2_44_13]KKT51765.1 MAG: hypothetical protein UW44_C0008G0087 [Candidatus Collierbacteria bacterium GW2011_GWB2_44_22]KKT65480.1 MAG: hypothetical protein UW58_C0029G0020 [Candidatus Collierbacteria bacterium GW2011_GWC2_44_30]KKT68301.1 MAG: hypothetical protein UW64_C0023G0017 [Microgenomates group bacterium GW2011_GWC1_44_37]KKT87989.1 MAG: hypothetical protein UW88_C0017G0010 [Candidatus Collierbacte
MASQAAFKLCVERLEGAMKRLQTLALMPEGEKLIAALSEADVTLKNPQIDVSATDLDPIFTLCAKVMKEAKAFKDAAEATELAQAKTALEDRYGTAAGLMAQWLDPEDDPCHFFPKMKALAESSRSMTWRKLDLAHDLLDDVFVAVNFAKMNAAESKATRPYRGWQFDREGNPARFAEAFLNTPVCQAYEVWLSERPSATDYKAVRAWIDRGRQLYDQLENPWKKCECGKNKLLPWYDEKAGVWKINDKCRDCRQPNSGSKSGPGKGQGELRQANSLTEDTIAALQGDKTFEGVTVQLSRRASVVGGSAAVKHDQPDDQEVETVPTRKTTRVKPTRDEQADEAEVGKVVPVSKKRGGSRKAKTPAMPKTTDKPRNPRKKGGHPIEVVDGTLS